MILRNPRTGAVLAHRVERASTPLARLRGLLGRSALPEGEALVIDPCASIHTFFMRFPIDAAFLTRDLRVVRAILDLKPWRATRPYREAAMVVELPGGTLARTGTREGDFLSIES
ncbi:MAG TPA: DUF192 domain-containing protein [Myxococcales bacterium]|nr:DUF192 domain-containing protein [Myxococcales bacterium]